MISFASRLFNVRSHEWPRLSGLYAMFFLIVLGSTWGRTIVEAAFLQQVGVQALPFVFMANAICTILAIPLYTAFADRVSNDRLLIAILLLSVVGIAAGFLLLQRRAVAIAYTSLYLILFVVLVDIFNLHWGTYINGFYDTRAAKRVVPVLISAARIAGVVAGLTMPLLNGLLQPGGVILLWLGATAIAGLIAWLLPRVLREGSPAPSAPPHAGPQLMGHVANIAEGYRYVVQSPYLRWMAVSTLLLMILVSLLTYQTSRIMLASLHTTEAIASFTGLLTGVANLAVLPLQLFWLSRIIRRLGLGNANLLFPGINLAASGGLALAPGLVTAAFGYLDRTVLRVTLQFTTDNLLYNAVPVRVKGRARAFVGGLVTPVGTLVGGGLLLATSAVGWLTPALIGLLAVAYAGSALVVRRLYAQAMIAILEHDEFAGLFLPGQAELLVADPATLLRLRQKLAASASYDQTIFIATLISQISGAEAIKILGQAAGAAGDASARAAILDVMAASGERGDELSQVYASFLADPAGQVRLSALAGLEHAAGPADAAFLDRAQQMLADAEFDVRLRALLALLRSGDAARQAPARQALQAMLDSADVYQRARGVGGLGQLGEPGVAGQLARHLEDPADEVRLEAALALERLAQNRLPAHVASLVQQQTLSLVHDPIERVRLAALNILAQIDTHEARQGIVEAMSDPNARVRTAVVDALAQLGVAVVPLVHPKLEAPEPQIRKMAAVILSRVSRKEFGGLIASLILGNLLEIYRNQSPIAALALYDAHPGASLMRSALRERNQELVDEIFYLLTAIHNPGHTGRIEEALHSASPLVRANAAEALEALTTPQIAGLIAPLFEPEFGTADFVRISKETWNMRVPSQPEAFRQFATEPHDLWTRAIMVAALGDIGAALSHDPTQTSAPGKAAELQLEIATLLRDALGDPAAEVREAARSAIRKIDGPDGAIRSQGEPMLSAIDKIVFLKEVPFFKSMTVDQLKVLVGVCEEEVYAENDHIYNQGDAGGALYIIVNGRVGIEQEKRKGSFARLMTVESHSYFGEMNLFDNSPRSASAVALQDTLVLRLRQAPLIALARQYPDLSLKLIVVLSERLREAHDRVAALTRTRPRELQQLYDNLG